VVKKKSEKRRERIWENKKEKKEVMNEGHDSSPSQSFDPYAHGLPSSYQFFYYQEEGHLSKTTEKIPTKRTDKKKKSKKSRIWENKKEIGFKICIFLILLSLKEKNSCFFKWTQIFLPHRGSILTRMEFRLVTRISIPSFWVPLLDQERIVLTQRNPSPNGTCLRPILESQSF
jgi:hypothetical protein